MITLSGRPISGQSHFFSPGPALRRKIQVAFGSEAVEVLDWRRGIVHPQQSVRTIFNCLFANASIVECHAD